MLTDRGVSEAVRSALTRLPLDAELDVSPEVEASRYHPTVEATAYFLVLEGLTNAMKHADSRTARVCLTCNGDLLEVSVTDTGRGFTVHSAQDVGTGLLGLRDRVAAIGGRLEILTAPGTGTTLRGLLPAHGHAGP